MILFALVYVNSVLCKLKNPCDLDSNDSCVLLLRYTYPTCDTCYIVHVFVYIFPFVYIPLYVLISALIFLKCASGIKLCIEYANLKIFKI